MRYLLVLFLGCLSLSAADIGHISANGIAREVVPPDRAEWHFSIYATAPTVAEASALAEAAVERLNARVKQERLPGNALVSEGMSQGAVWDFEHGKRVSDGYFSELSFKLTVADLTMFSRVSRTLFVDNLIRIQNVVIASSKQEEAQRQAVRAAVSDASANARIVADQLGVKLGPLNNVSYQFENTGPTMDAITPGGAIVRTTLPPLDSLVVTVHAFIVYDIAK